MGGENTGVCAGGVSGLGWFKPPVLLVGVGVHFLYGGVHRMSGGGSFLERLTVRRLDAHGMRLGN